MIQEFLVVLACSQGSGCPQTTDAYYSSHPEIKQLARNVDTKAKQIVGPEVVLLSPAVLLLARQRGTVNITKYISAQIQSNGDKLLIFHLSF